MRAQRLELIWVCDGLTFNGPSARKMAGNETVMHIGEVRVGCSGSEPFVEMPG